MKYSIIKPKEIKMSEVLKNIADANAAGTPIFVSAAEGDGSCKGWFISLLIREWTDPK